MTWGGEALLNLHNWWHGAAKHKAAIIKTAKPIRIGVLSTATINPSALFDPVDSHPDVIIVAVASRSLAKAEAQIAKYGLKGVKAYGSYTDLLEDPDIDAIYNPLPNGLHCEWTIKAMQAGKHALIEKPIASNAQEVEQIRRMSEATGKIALEALHWRFHPAAHLVKSLATSGQYGEIQSISAQMGLPANILIKDDIRFQYKLGGGACMDLTYVFSASCYFASTDINNCEFDILEVQPRLAGNDKDVDEAMKAVFLIKQPAKPDIRCDIDIDLARPMDHLLGVIPKLWDIVPRCVIELDSAQISFPNFPGPWVYCRISVTEKDSDGALTNRSRIEQCYEGGPEWKDRGARFWTTYRYMLEAFVDAIRSRSRVQVHQGPWMTLEESAKLMELIDLVYQKADLPPRGRG